MQNHNQGFIVPVLLLVIALLVVGGGFYVYQNKEAEIPVVTDTDSQPAAQTPPAPSTPPAVSNEQKVLTAARAVIGALSARDYSKLAGLVSNDGLSLSNNPSFDSSKNLIAKKDISGISNDTKTYLWGYSDGKGEAIKVTRAEFLAKYIYNNSVDYSKAPNVAVNKTLGSGNSLNTVDKDVNGRMYAAFYFPGIDPQYGGMDWTTLYLIFDSVNGEYELRGIAKDNWTI